MSDLLKIKFEDDKIKWWNDLVVQREREVQYCNERLALAKRGLYTATEDALNTSVNIPEEYKVDGAMVSVNGRLYVFNAVTNEFCVAVEWL
jgi:hypothetical protein